MWETPVFLSFLHFHFNFTFVLSIVLYMYTIFSLNTVHAYLISQCLAELRAEMIMFAEALWKWLTERRDGGEIITLWTNLELEFRV